MKPLVSILTPSIPSRAAMLAECKASVAAQTMRSWEHLIKVDANGRGCARIMNELARTAQGDWLLPLADDDLLLPGALEAMQPSLNGPRTVVYAPPLVWGRDPSGFLGNPPEIPSFALIARDYWLELGGYNESLIREEDRDLWRRVLNSGGSFVRADAAPTWIYRMHGGNKSFHSGRAS